MTHRIIIVVAALVGLVAFCTDSFSGTLDLIQNERVRAYSRDEFEWGAPSLPITSKILHREALEDLSHGRRDAAVQKLRLAADLSGDYAAPLFTLARVELLSGNPDFLFHFGEGIRRAFTEFPNSGAAALNGAALAVLALCGALFVLLVSLLSRHWHFLNHQIVESLSLRFTALPARWILPIAVTGLALMRLGIGLYIALLIAFLWARLSGRERLLVFSTVLIIAAASAMAPYSNRLAPAVDPGSVTHRLSLVNEHAVNAQRLEEMRTVDEERYRAERDFAIGTMMYRLGLYNEARVHLLEAVSIRNRFAVAFLNLGNVYFMQGDYDKALAGYRSAVEIDSTNVVAHYNIGQAYIKKLLFAQSGVWLERANALGIERYRAAHPALDMRSAVVYEQGFSSKDLWAIAAREGRERDRVILSEMLQPFLLFPFHRLWILLAGAFGAGLIYARRLTGERLVLQCENCGRATCPRCLEMIFSVRLCRECSEVVQGISSVKVMEVLLRTRRQKVAGAAGGISPWLTALLPGMKHIRHGKALIGCTLAFVAAAAAVSLAWSGCYFKDPLALNVGNTLWEIALAAGIIAAAYAASFTVRAPQEPRNYHIFPPEIRSQNRESGANKMDESPDLWLSPGSAPPAGRRQAADASSNAPTDPEAGKSPVRADTFWGNEMQPAPPPRPRPREKTKAHEGAPQYGMPNRPGQHTDTADFLAEIKKGSSWR
jgi:tetratricopeptide (TPR) repeat protein